MGKPSISLTDLGLGFGLGLSLVTVIVRIIIFPLGIYQSWKATYQSEKMNYLKPIFCADPRTHQKMRRLKKRKLLANSELMDAQKKQMVSAHSAALAVCLC